jgi:hypothetical protein
MSSTATNRLTALLVAALAALAATLALTAPALSDTTKTPTPGKPHASTGGVAHFAGTTGQLQGTVNPEGADTTYFFRYGPTTAYGSQTAPVSAGSGFDNVKVGQSVGGLHNGFHYRLIAQNANGEAQGKDKTVTGGKKKLSFKFPRTKSKDRLTGYGGAYVLTGTLTGQGGGNHQIQLQSQPYPYSGTFTPVGPVVTTGATGAFSLRIANMTQNTKFRVVAPGPRPLLSAEIVVSVAVRVSVHVRSTSHTGLARIYGTVAPATAGQAIVELLKPAKETSKREANGPKAQAIGATKLKLATKTLSRFSAVLSIRASGNYRVFVRLAKGPLVSGYSQDVKIRTHAAPSKAKAKHKGKRKRKT